MRAVVVVVDAPSLDDPPGRRQALEEMLVDPFGPTAALLSHPGTPLVAGGAIALMAGMVAVRVVRGFSRSRVTAPRRQVPKGWNGTVRVMLPVPRDDN